MSADLNAISSPRAEPLEPNACFENSRRLTGVNLYFASTGAVLEASVESLGTVALDVDAHNRWRVNVCRLATGLGWHADARIAPHASGVMLALAAPFHQLLTATEINEWAWEEAIGEEYFIHAKQASDKTSSIQNGNLKNTLTFDRIHPANGDGQAVLEVFRTKAQAEMSAPLLALCDAATQRHLPFFLDDTTLSIGTGAGSQSWPTIDSAGARITMPAPSEVQWHALYDIPKVLVTGSNGKTTTVRLLGALLSSLRGQRETANVVGYCCTEGVVIGGIQMESGDYSGPAGARTVLRHPNVKAAVLETARGGILRRGLAVGLAAGFANSVDFAGSVNSAEVAIITNISADHFGEYGIDNIDDLADVKLVVAKVLGKTGTLVLNADDPVLMARAANLACLKALFSMDDKHPLLMQHRAAGGACCTLRAESLWLTHHGVDTRLGAVAEMPLTVGGIATYNIANIAAASLGAALLGIEPHIIGQVLMRFGRRHQDNPGRLERWIVAGVTVLVDYAHNPEGLIALLQVANSLRTTTEGRLGLLLGQAGNREDDAIAELAKAAAEFKPNRVVIKELTTMLRGRALGEVPAILDVALRRTGLVDAQISHEPDEVAAALNLLQWAKAGDVVVLPIHQKVARGEVVAFIESKMVHADDR